jgi:glycosyltransferase involved in cell wall biosynthesis
MREYKATNLDYDMRNDSLYIYTKGKKYKGSLDLDDIIIMTGHTNEVYKYLSISDLYVMTSYREGLSVAVIEAMAVGLPLVLYDFSGSDDQVEIGKNGFIVMDIEQTKSLVNKMIENPSVLQEISKKSIELAKRFDWKVVIKDWEKVLERLIEHDAS